MKNSTKSSVAALPNVPVKAAAVISTRGWRRHRLDIPIRVIVHTAERTKLYDGRGNELNEAARPSPLAPN